MSDKVLKIAGKNPEGNSQGVSVDSNGNLLTSESAEIILQREVTKAAGEVEFLNFHCGSPFKIFFFIDDSNNTDVPWEIRISSERVWKEGEDSSSRRILPLGASLGNTVVIESDGSVDVVTGNGTRASAYSDLLKPSGNHIQAILTNNDPSRPLVGRIFVVKYAESRAIWDNPSAQDYPDVINSQIVVDEETPATQVLYETDDFTRIEYLEIGSNNATSPSLQIRPKDQNGNDPWSLGIMNQNTGTGGGMSMAGLDENRSSLFDKMYREADGSKYALNRYMTFPYGVKLVVVKGSAPVGTSFGIRGYAVRTKK